MTKPFSEVTLDFLSDLIAFTEKIREPEEDKVWGWVVEKLSLALDAEAATYYAYLPAKRHLLARYVLGDRPDGVRAAAVEAGKGICGWVASHREPTLVKDAYADARFLKDMDEKTGFRTKSVLCLPLLDRLDLAGVVEFLNKRSGFFSSDDLRLAQAACQIVTLALRAAKIEATYDRMAARNADIIENSTGGFIAVDTHGRLIVINGAAKRIFSLDSAIKLNIPIEEALLNAPQMSDLLLETLAHRTAVRRQEFAWSPVGGGPQKIIGYSTLLIQDPGGQVSGAAVSFQDITQHVKKEEKK